MIYCEDCQREAQGLRHVAVFDGEINSKFYRYVCAECNGTQIREVNECTRCGGPNLTRYDEICDKCKDELKERLKKFLKEFTEAEQEAMLEDL